MGHGEGEHIDSPARYRILRQSAFTYEQPHNLRTQYFPLVNEKATRAQGKHWRSACLYW